MSRVAFANGPQGAIDAGAEEAVRLGDDETAKMFAGSDWERKFPPILTVAQAAELAQVPVGTIYDWSSRRELNNCAARRGKRLRILRNRFVKFLVSKENRERR